MILVDDRIGSVELVPLLSIPNNVCRLEFGDFAWSGHGPEGQVSIGVERKRISDFLSSMTTGRLSGHQLIGLSANFDFVYLIVEGVWRPERGTGILQIPCGKGWQAAQQGSRRFMVRDIYNFINTLQIICGVHVVTTYNDLETVKWLESCYSWWQKKWEAHKSHLQFRDSDHAHLVRPSLVARIANQFPGIGLDRARHLAEKFKSPIELVLATKEELEKVEGIGKTLAKNLVRQING